MEIDYNLYAKAGDTISTNATYGTDSVILIKKQTLLITVLHFSKNTHNFFKRIIRLCFV